MVRKIENADDFCEAMLALKFQNSFNPYTDQCSHFDHASSPQIRLDNLRIVLGSALEKGVSTMWVGRDLGYRGGRRTGLALTDEPHLDRHGELFDVKGLRKSTLGNAVSERTANVIWEVLRRAGQRVFLWNVFPLHPHEKENALTNRPHTKKEAEDCAFLLHWLLSRLRPGKVIAIGRDAEKELGSLPAHLETVRHPSYGGQSEFTRKMEDIYKLAPSATKQLRLF